MRRSTPPLPAEPDRAILSHVWTTSTCYKPLEIERRQKDFIQVPLVARLRTPPSQPIGAVLPKLPTPLADRFVGHRDAAFEQEFFHITVAQGEAIIEPDPVTDDFARKAVVLVAFAGAERGHVGLPILEFAWSGRRHHQGNYVMGQEAGSTS